MLSPDDRQRLKDIAEAEGVDPDELIAEAERAAGDKGEGANGKAGKDDEPTAKLYMYLLPFVRVREVRQRFLGLTDPFPGDDQVASDWSRAHPIASATDSNPDG